MSRCANPECRRVVFKHPVVVRVGDVTLVYGSTCARRAGLLPPKARTTRRYAVARPRVLELPPVEVLPDQLELPIEGIGE